MSLIQWNNSLCLGIPSIDKQHETLLNIINELHTAVDGGHGLEVIGQTLEKLILYTIDHFQYEEQLFMQTAYPGSMAHKNEHQELAKQVQDISNRYKRGQDTLITQETLVFLVDWFLNHTQGSDREYSEHLIAAGVV